MRVLDQGHLYELAELDGGEINSFSSLRFVKRVGDRFPGNVSPAYAGTTMQEVLRALIDRAEYVNRQIPCAETEASIALMEAALLLMEIRAKRVKGKNLDVATVDSVVHAATCPHCQHVLCTEHIGVLGLGQPQTEAAE